MPIVLRYPRVDCQSIFHAGMVLFFIFFFLARHASAGNAVFVKARFDLIAPHREQLCCYVNALETEFPFRNRPCVATRRYFFHSIVFLIFETRGIAPCHRHTNLITWKRGSVGRYEKSKEKRKSGKSVSLIPEHLPGNRSLQR